MKRLLCLVTGLGLLLASGALAADAVKIGLMGPMTGAWASEGQEMRQVVGLLADSSAEVRAAAATTVGGMGHVAAAAQLETMVVSDPDPIVRRNAAWALGKLQQPSSKAALAAAVTDKSGLVRMTARASLASIR